MKNNRNSFITLTFLHFCVDFVCVCGLYFIAKMLDDKGKDDLFISVVFLLYNCLAFLLQPFFGMLIDRFKDPKKTKNFKYLVLLSLGVLLLGWTLFMILEVGKNLIFLMFIVVILFGLSNALFHVSAGKQVLMFTNRATPGGLFVSTGALGVGLGSGVIYAGAFEDIVGMFFVLIPILVIALVAVNYFSELDLDNNEKYSSYSFESPKLFSIVVIVLCIAIGIRSFLGFYTYISDDITDNFFPAIFMLSVAAFMGKAVGGMLLDMGGPSYVVIASTVLSTIFAIFAEEAFASYIYIFSFNLLMPVTLDLLRRYFPNKEGFAFGLAAAFLVPGYLIGSALNDYGEKSEIIPFICLLTGIAIFVVYHLNKKATINERDN